MIHLKTKYNPFEHAPGTESLQTNKSGFGHVKWLNAVAPWDFDHELRSLKKEPYIATLYRAFNL